MKAPKEFVRNADTARRSSEKMAASLGLLPYGSHRFSSTLVGGKPQFIDRRYRPQLAGSFRSAVSIATPPYFGRPIRISPAPHQGTSASGRCDHLAQEPHLRT